MKYMGSKRAMLTNGLGKTLLQEVEGATQFADLFTGSGIVAWYVAQQLPVPVLATDLQHFAAALAESVIGRTTTLDAISVWDAWADRARVFMDTSGIADQSICFQNSDWFVHPEGSSKNARKICQQSEHLPVTYSYGGYYFSPLQALQLDALRVTLPSNATERAAALAALIQAAAQCAAAPGHTAQPFKPTERAAPYLWEAWRRDVPAHTHMALTSIAERKALVEGHSATLSASEAIEDLPRGSVAFVDPPYSSVHYSRFYHVLETISKGRCSSVTGEGRYPPTDERPSSHFSIPSKATAAFDNLLCRLAEREVRTIVTFPANEASNGLSGKKVEDMASGYFHIQRSVVASRFSTLGGNTIRRSARVAADELILVLRPR